MRLVEPDGRRWLEREAALLQVSLRCDWLETTHGYIFRSWQAAWGHVLAQYGQPLRAAGQRMAQRGPCAGHGYHRNIMKGSSHMASVVQCPCGTDDDQIGERLRVIP
jgi:hypothetical protein